MPTPDHTAAPSDEPALLTIEGAVATITLNRPAAFNSVDLSIAKKLEQLGAEVEDGLLAEVGRVEIARMDQKLVALGAGLRDDLAVGIDDQAASNEWEAVLDAGFGDGHDPRRVLICARLH